MPIVGNEAAEYGYENENRAFTRWFLDGVQPELELPRRPRRHRAADGVLHERGGGAGDRMETVEPAIVRAAAGQAMSRREFGAVAASGSLRLVAPKPWRRRIPARPRSHSASRATASAIARSTMRLPACRSSGLRSCELWQDHVEPRSVPREELRRWRETVSIDAFHRVRDQLAKASITLSAYNISITDSFSDAEIERALRDDRRARRAAHHVVVEHRHGRAHCAGRRAAEDGRGDAQSLADRSQRVRHARRA